MYTWEINKEMIKYNFKLPSKIYLKICSTSPQICRVKLDSYDDMFEIWTKDNGYFKFEVDKFYKV